VTIVALSFTASMAATGHVSIKSPPPPPPPPRVAPHVPAPHRPAGSTGSSRSTTSAVQTSDLRHRNRDDVVVFGDPFWDPLWDLDADLALGYAPYAYPPREWAYDAQAKVAARRGLVPIELHVHPWKASVIVDDSPLGQARDYNDDSHPLFLAAGKHDVELQYPGYETLRFELSVQRGLPRDLHYSLIKGDGMDPRSAETSDSAAGRSRG
jgi:hypothetical protein